MSILGWETHKLQIKEADLCLSINCKSWIYYNNFMHIIYDLDLNSIERLWNKDEEIYLFCNLESEIRIYHNLVQCFKTKHIALQYRFIKDHVEDGNVEFHFVRLGHQLADIFTNSILETTFNPILHGLGMIEAKLVPKCFWKVMNCEIVLFINERFCISEIIASHK